VVRRIRLGVQLREGLHFKRWTPSGRLGHLRRFWDCKKLNRPYLCVAKVAGVAGVAVATARFALFMDSENPCAVDLILPPYFRTRAIRDVAPARTEQGAVGRRDVA
jgi:hypothetical protein